MAWIWIVQVIGCLLCDVARSQVVAVDAVVSNSAYATQTNPAIAAQAETLVAVNASGAGDAVTWTYSTDAGRHWSQNGFGYIPSSDPHGGAWAAADVCSSPRSGFFCAEYYLSNTTAPRFALQRALSGQAGLVWGKPKFLVQASQALGDHLDSPHIRCDAATGTLYFTYSRQIYDTSANEMHSSVYFMRSLDDGVTWTAPVSLSNQYSVGGYMAIGSNGEIYVCWEDYLDGSAKVRRSDDHGVTFSPSVATITMNDNAGAFPAMYIGNGSRVFPPYPLPACSNFYPGFPTLDVDRTNGPHRGSIYMAWAPRVVGSLSPTMREIGEADYHSSFGSAMPVRFGDVVFGSTYNVDDPYDTSGTDLFAIDGVAGTTIQIDGTIDYPKSGGNLQICEDYYLLGGADTLHLKMLIWAHFRNEVVPPLVYTIPITGRYYLVLGGSLPSWSYHFSVRQLTPDAGSVSRDMRDIALTSSVDQGASWGPPVRVNDSPPRFDECLPTVLVDNFGKVNVAWYGHSDGSPLGERPDTYWSFSRDGGRTFEHASKLSSASGKIVDYQIGASNPGWRVEDHLALIARGSEVFCAWTDVRNTTTSIRGCAIEVSEPTGLAISGFGGTVTGSRAQLSWRLEDPSGVIGMHVWRGVPGGASARVTSAPIPIDGIGDMMWLDPGTLPAGGVEYKLELLRRGADSQWFGRVRLTPVALGGLRWLNGPRGGLFGAAPMRLSVPTAGRLMVRVMGIEGRSVAVLRAEDAGIGVLEIDWDGRDQHGLKAPAGVYLVRASTGSETATTRVLLLH